MPSKLAQRIDGMGKKITDLLPSTQGGFLTNKWFLYLVLASAVFDLFYFYGRGDMYALTIFFIIGLLASFFSKNMVVILILAIVLTHLIRYGKNLSEGFENEEELEESFEGEGEDEEEDKEGFEGEDEEEDKEESFEGEYDEEEKDQFKDIGSSSAQIKATGNVVNGLKPANMDEQTRELLTTQKQLMENMKTLEPMLAKAESFLSKKNEKFTNLADAYRPLTR